MLWVPPAFVERERQREQREQELAARRAAHQAYREAHERCPKCKGDFVETTCMGFFGNDRNRANCLSCGWVGIVHDMVSAPASPATGKKVSDG